MKTIMVACLASLIALPAMADRNPPPSPSGVTIHLFGPQLITTTNSSGAAPSSSSGQAASAPQGTNGGSTQYVTINGASAPLSPSNGSPVRASSTSSASEPAANVNAQPEPTWGELLHQMFVTGAPGQKNKPHIPHYQEAPN